MNKFEGIKRNDSVVLDAGNEIFEGDVISTSGEFIKIRSNLTGEKLFLKKSDVLEVNVKEKVKKEIAGVIKQSVYFGLQAIAEAKNISIDAAVQLVLEKYTWKEVEDFKRGKSAAENAKRKFN